MRARITVCAAWLLCSGAAWLVACSSGGGADGSETSGGTTTGSPGSSDGTTAATTSAATSSSTTATSDASTTTGGVDSSGDAPIFDLPVPDGGDVEPPGGIPQTCAQAVTTQSTVGCSFHGNKMQNFIEEPTSIVVGNVTDGGMANVQLFGSPGGVETPVGAPVMLAPGETHEFVLNEPPEPGDVSVLRQGGPFRVESDVPLVAYQHSPIAALAHNDSSMLIPDHALGQYHIVAAWGTNVGNDYSAFNVVGVHDGTTVSWTPPNQTLAGTGVPAVAAFATGEVDLDHYDLLQVVAPIDASGTIVETSQPAWVIGTVPCVNVPAQVPYCDHIEEQLIPLEYWGTEYVGAHAPTRGSEQYWWRVYSGSDGVTVSTVPPQPGTPVLLDRGQYHEFAADESFLLSADGPVMPVQYLEGQEGGAGTGDPASYQMVPIEQFLPRYVFVTGKGYTVNYAQIIRPLGAPDVLVDDVVVDGYYAVGGFEIADWPIAEGPHVAASVQPFGVVQIGYTSVTSYAYPGGLALGFINPDPEG